MTAPAWTEEDSDRLDRWAASSWRDPLGRDRTLWDLLALDRQQAPRRPSEDRRPFACIDCRHPLRGWYEPDADGFVLHRARGLCEGCCWLRKERGIPMPGKKAKDVGDCLECQQPMVPQKAPARAGHVSHHARGLCRSCYFQHLRESGRTCVGCSVALRPRKHPEHRYPFRTEPHAGGDLCRPCYDARSRKGLKVGRMIAPEKCEGCDHPLRPSKRLASDFPGTRRHYAKGLCGPCHYAKVKAGG